MADFGGLGGLAEYRQINEADLFEMAINRALGDAMREDTGLCKEVWSALANQDWLHENGDNASYSFRAAGDLIAAILGEGNYMDWYCSGPYETVSDRIEDAMRREGWKPHDPNT
jgi:hypothetical protein